MRVHIYLDSLVGMLTQYLLSSIPVITRAFDDNAMQISPLLFSNQNSCRTKKKKHTLEKLSIDQTFKPISHRTTTKLHSSLSFFFPLVYAKTGKPRDFFEQNINSKLPKQLNCDGSNLYILFSKQDSLRTSIQKLCFLARADKQIRSKSRLCMLRVPISPISKLLEKNLFKKNQNGTRPIKRKKNLTLLPPSNGTGLTSLAKMSFFPISLLLPTSFASSTKRRRWP
jgi:hypothetical protein